MRISTALLLVFGLLSARGTLSDKCFKQSGSDLELTQGCASGEAIVLSKSDEFTITIDAGRGDGDSKGTLKIGGCHMDLKLGKISTDRILSVNGNPIKLPTTVTVKQGSVEFSRKDGSSYVVSPSCSPTFKQVDDGNTIDVEYSMSPPASDLSMLFKGVRIYSKDENDGGLKIGIILAVLGIALLLSACVGVGLFFFRRWKSKEQEKRVKQEDEAKLAKEEEEAKKAEAKKAEEKKAEKKKAEVKKAEVKKTEMKAEAKKAEVKKAEEKKAEEKKAEEKKAEAEPIAKQVDETKSEDSEEVPPFKQVEARKESSPPLQDWAFTPSRKRSRRSKRRGSRSRKDKEAYKRKLRTARRLLSGKRSSKVGKLATPGEVRLDEVFAEPNQEQITTAILPE